MVEIVNKTRSNISKSKVLKVANIFLERNRLARYDVSIAFVGDVKMRLINKKYRGHDKTTDVLSFIEEDKDEDSYLGEILINYQQIKRQAKKRKAKIEDELVFILVHGLLHLVGYEDETAKDLKRMKEKGSKFIKKYIN